MKIFFRKALLSDVGYIKTCLIDSWVTHAKNNPELLDEERMRKSSIDSYYAKAFNDSDNSFILIAEVNGMPVGFIRGDKQDIPNFFKYSNILYIDDIYVSKEFRRHGIAKRLIEEIEVLAKKNQIKRLQCRIYTFNNGTQKLFASLGYKSPHSTWDKVV